MIIIFSIVLAGAAFTAGWFAGQLQADWRANEHELEDLDRRLDASKKTELPPEIKRHLR